MNTHPIKPELFESMADTIRECAERFELIRLGCKCHDEVQGLEGALIRARLATLLAANYTATAAAMVQAHNDQRDSRSTK